MRQAAFKASGAGSQQAHKFGWSAGGQGQGDFGFGGGKGQQTVSVTYDDEAISELLYMIEEEKLAGDLYEAFFDLYGLKIFDNIASSEDQHFESLIKQATKIGLDVDEFVLQPAGSFADDDLQALYDEFLAIGSQSADSAINVGIAIEETDIVDLARAADMVEGTPLSDVYDNLLAGSANHLEAFEAWLI